MVWTPAHPAGRISDVDCSEGGSSCRSFELAWIWQSTCLRFMALTDKGMLSFAKPCVEDRSRRFLPIFRLAWSGWKLPTAQQMVQSLATLRQTIEQMAAGQDELKRDIVQTHSALINVLVKIPEPLRQPPAAAERKPVPAPPPSSRAPTASSRSPIPPQQ
jgi:hypothetical protein